MRVSISLYKAFKILPGYSLFGLVLLLLTAFVAGAQSFDEFSLDNEVRVFLRKEFRSLKNFRLGLKVPKEENQWYLDSLSYSPWFVSDFNKDGISDLFVTGMENGRFQSYLILAREEEHKLPVERSMDAPRKRKDEIKSKKKKDKKLDFEDEEEYDMEEWDEGSDENEDDEEFIDEDTDIFKSAKMSYELVEVVPPRSRATFIVPFIEETLEGPLILIKQFATEQKITMRNGVQVRFPKSFNQDFQMGFLRKDTFIYKFGGIVEYNAAPSSGRIKYIQFHSYCQYGGCPDYKLKIDSAGNMILHNIKNTDEAVGVYKSQCSLEDLKNVMDLANYVKYTKDDIRFGDSSADLVITLLVMYQDGKSKRIVDYKLGGTLSLSRLYDLLYEVKSKASWQ